MIRNPATGTTGNGARPPLEPQLQRAILETFVYADMFHYPLARDEVHRYVPWPAAPEEVVQALTHSVAEGRLIRSNGYFALPGREALIPLREQREKIAQRKWAAARRYVHWLALLPFVRLVAVTGTLAVNNVEEEDDIDVFVVTETGRLWLCRALVVLIVRLAALAGDELCPNYFVSERQLAFADEDFFTAREVAQMVPLYGSDIYWRIRELNPWVKGFLPQADGLPNPAHHTDQAGQTMLQLGLVARGTKSIAEWVLRSPLGDRLERWEMARKVPKFERSAEATQAGTSVAFTADCCKGHFAHHESTITREFDERLKDTGLRAPD